MRYIQYLIATLALTASLITGCSSRHSEQDQSAPAKQPAAMQQSSDDAIAEDEKRKKQKLEQRSMPGQETNQAIPSEDDMERLD
jgi:hypothetical protein